MRKTAELFAREFALTLSTDGERLHASIFKGQELREGHCEIPVSLELVSVLEEYERTNSSESLVALEAKMKTLADEIVREMKGDRVSRNLTKIFGGSDNLQYYVNWRAVVLKIHETFMHIEGLDEILELHKPGSKARKQVAFASHPTRDMAPSKSSISNYGHNNSQPKVRLSLKPTFTPIRATPRSASFQTSEQERKENLLRMLPATPDPKLEPVGKGATPEVEKLLERPLERAFRPVTIPASEPEESMEQDEPPMLRLFERVTSPANVAIPVKQRSNRSALVLSMGDAPEEELSLSLPTRFAGAPPSELKDSITRRTQTVTAPIFAPVITPIPVDKVEEPKAATPREDVAPPFRLDSATLEQLVVVQPTDRFWREEVAVNSAPRAVVSTGEPLKAPEWMRFVVHWNDTKLEPGPSADPRGVRIPLSFLLMAIQAHGEYDHALAGVVCLALWKAAGSPKLTLGPYLPPGFLDRNGIRMANRAVAVLEKDFKRLCEGPVSDAQIRSLQKHFVLAQASKEREALRAVLTKLTNGVCFAVRANVIATLERYEGLCISLLGAQDEHLREAAVKLLNVIYDQHDWQKTEAFDTVIRNVGDCFVVEMDLVGLGEARHGNVMLQVCMAPQQGSGQRVFFTVKPRLTNMHDSGSSLRKTGGSSEKVVVDWLPSFSRCGFVDWRFVSVDDSGVLVPFSSTQACCGRVIVLPRSFRRDAIHEVAVSGSFASIASRLQELKSVNNVNTIYLSGACSGASLEEVSDRRVPNAAAGGVQAFTELANEAKKIGVHLIVDADHRISASSHARRYSNLITYRMDPLRRFLIPVEGHDGLHMSFPKAMTLNYRKKETWDELVGDVMHWCSLGASGVRLAASHCAPLILQTDVPEMARQDPDGQQHYTIEQIFEGLVCLPPSNEAVTYGYFGTEAAATYPNPLLVKIATTVWRHFPDVRLFSESYWGRASNSLSSGWVPQSAELATCLNSLFGVSVTPDYRKVSLPTGPSSVKVLYDWFREERSRYPSNSVVVNASSHHYLPYPLLLHGPGAWATVDLLYFGPDIPSTFAGEAMGEHRWTAAHIHVPHEITSLDIKGHYSHRSRLRSNYRVLQEGGFLPLLTFWGDSADQKSWHDRVFAFARFTSDKVAICAINFNSVDSTVYIDLSPLVELCDQADGTVFKIIDMIDPSQPQKYFVPSEFLQDKHFVTLRPYRSLLWGLFVEAMSPAMERALYEQSFRRLQTKLNHHIDASANLLYKELSQSFESQDKFGATISRLLRILKPDPRSGTFPEDLRQMLYFLSRNNKGLEASILSYLSNLSSTGADLQLQDIAARILESNAIGPIVFVTPEMGRFSTVGGIGVMVSELTRSLAELGLDVRVISPYYNYDKKGNTGYLAIEGIKWQQNIVTSSGNEFIECGLHTGEEMGVKLYFIHHWKYFSTPYQSGTPADQLQALVIMAKASLELLCQLHVIPSIIVTNDWFTALVPAYGRVTGSFGSSFVGTTFFHLLHNLEQGYEGKIYIDGDDDMGHIHQMRRDLIVESFDGRCTVLNSSKCALICSNQWGTVSRSYRDDLLRVSPLQHFLKRFEAPFAHLNGIRSADRLEILRKTGASDHAEAKKRVQEKYFGHSDPSIALFAFVGRVVLQKGVHLILECARSILSRRDCKVQIMVCGPANNKDPYAASCAWKMAALKTEFGGSFWADPDVFFTDGTLVNTGADFALMPSLFEPSGIVQQEFFSGGTPVIAFKTGGLKDTVFELNTQTGTGNGFTFEAHQFPDLMAAIERALRVFNNAEVYSKLRQNARNSVLDNAVVADAWTREFCRLKQRLWNPPTSFKDQENSNHEEQASK